jgi:hypothetical protein
MLAMGGWAMAGTMMLVACDGAGLTFMLWAHEGETVGLGTHGDIGSATGNITLSVTAVPHRRPWGRVEAPRGPPRLFLGWRSPR